MLHNFNSELTRNKISCQFHPPGGSRGPLHVSYAVKICIYANNSATTECKQKFGNGENFTTFLYVLPNLKGHNFYLRHFDNNLYENEAILNWGNIHCVLDWRCDTQHNDIQHNDTFA